MPPRQGVQVSSRTVYGDVPVLQRQAVVWTHPTYPADEYGRRYHVELHHKTRSATFIKAMFQAPLQAPPQCLSIPRGRPWEVQIDWKRWIGECLSERAAYVSMVRDVARNQHLGRGKTVRELLEDPEILGIVGPKPGAGDWSSNPELIALAYHGDPWCLGLQVERTPAVLKVIGDEPERITVESIMESDFNKDIADLLEGSPTISREAAQRRGAGGRNLRREALDLGDFALGDNVDYLDTTFGDGDDEESAIAHVRAQAESGAFGADDGIIDDDEPEPLEDRAGGFLAARVAAARGEEAIVTAGDRSDRVAHYGNDDLDSPETRDAIEDEVDKDATGGATVRPVPQPSRSRSGQFVRGNRRVNTAPDQPNQLGQGE